MRQLTLGMAVLLALASTRSFADEDTAARDLTKVRIPADFVVLEANGFVLRHPARLKPQKDENAWLMASPNDDVAIHATTTDLPQEDLITAVAQETRKQLAETVANIEYQSFAPATIPAGGRAYFLEFTGEVDATPMKFWQLIAAKETTCYIVSFTATAERAKEMAPVAEQVFASLKPAK